MGACDRRGLRWGRAILGLGLVAAAGVAAPVAARASEPHPVAAAAPKSLPGIDVVQVEGLIDPPNASLVRHSISRAERRRSTLLVFQLDSGGAVDVDVAALVQRVRNARVPIAVWIGPSGATARGGAALIAEGAPVLSISPGSHIGPSTPMRLDRPGEKIAPSLVAAQEKVAPAVTLTPLPRPVTGTGSARLLIEPSPSCPLLFWPQQRT